jgi:serine protease Do
MKSRSVFALILGLTLGLAIGILGSGIAASPPGGAGTPEIALVQAPITSATFAKLADAVKPAVINVNVQSKGGGRSPLDEFFGGGGDDSPRGTRRGIGSGVIIDPSGTALTNAHVVDGASDVEVVTLDGAKHKAKVLGIDKKTDLAVLRLEGSKPFPYLKLADSDEVRVGDWVLAIGSPFGLQATVTSGIVSAKARQIGAGPYDDFLQTDAAINPGNSGGPLVNMRGEVIGINTAIVRGGNGIGFAIPANLVKRVSAELADKGSVTRGWLGVGLQPLTPDLAASFNAKDKAGVLVSEVVPGSPAAKAGVKAGDIVVEFNAKKVQNPGELARAVGLAKPGQDTKVTIWRDGAEKTLEVKLAEAPGEPTRSRLGLDVRPLTPDVAREVGVEGTDGVVVAAVEEGSVADDAGIRRGDVIKELDRKPVKSISDFEKAAADLKGNQPVTVRLQRGRTSLFVALDMRKG